MVWIEFLLSAALIVFAATRLAKYGDVIAIRTRLGGMFIGILLMAGATSLPELLTTISSIGQGVPNLAAGNLFGSNLFNMLMLAGIDLVGQQKRILRNAVLKHALTGSLAAFMILLAVFFMVADIDIKVGWVGVDSIVIILTYGLSIFLIQENSMAGTVSVDEEIPEGTPSLRNGVIGFAAASAVLIFITPLMVRSSTDIAEITGLGTTFVGTTLVAIVTSLPEMVTTMAALRLGAVDMAIGNLFGSNMFNMFALGLTDFFYLPGRFLGIIDPSFLLVGLLGLLMTMMGLIGNLAVFKRRAIFLEFDALALILVYFGGLWLLYIKSIVP